MKRPLFACLAILTTAALTACGGGGGDAGDPPADAIDKYIGSWSNCFPNGARSAKVTATFVKTSATGGNYSFVTNGYASTNCSGTAASSSTDTGTAVLQGTKVIGTETVEKVTFTSTIDGAQKQVVVIRNRQLLLGLTEEDGGTVDTNGYPNALDTNFPLLKQ